jgi:hypothetical protein
MNFNTLKTQHSFWQKISVNNIITKKMNIGQDKILLSRKLLALSQFFFEYIICPKLHYQ